MRESDTLNYSSGVFSSSTGNGLPGRISFIGEIVRGESPINVFLGQFGDHVGVRCLIPNGPGQLLFSEGRGRTPEEALVNALGDRDGRTAITVMHGFSAEAARRAA